MEKSSELMGLLICLLFCVLIPAGMLWLNALLGPKNPASVKEQPFECGLRPFALPEGHLSPHFYLVAVFFVLFDVLSMFFVLWATAIKELRFEAFAVLIPFMIILATTYLFAWRQRLFETE